MSDANPDKVYQLRVYEVNNAKRDVFHQRFRDHALRIMARYGFKMVAMWESTTVTDFEFIYLLEWPDQTTMERQWQAFLADPEWTQIKRRTAEESGDIVISATGRLLSNLEYGPGFSPA